METRVLLLIFRRFLHSGIFDCHSMGDVDDFLWIHQSTCQKGQHQSQLMEGHYRVQYSYGRFYAYLQSRIWFLDSSLADMVIQNQY